MRPQVFGHRPGTSNVDVGDPVELVVGQLEEGRTSDTVGDRGIVHQANQVRVETLQLVGQGADGLDVSDVGDDGGREAPGGDEVFGCGMRGVGITFGDHHVMALAAEPSGNGSPQSASAAGDHHGPGVHVSVLMNSATMSATCSGCSWMAT